MTIRMSYLRIMLGCTLGLIAQSTMAAKYPAMADILASSKNADWRALDPETTLYVELPVGRVIIDLASRFAPLHIAKIKALARKQYFNGLPINRVQENYVVQWSDPRASSDVAASAAVAPEFDVLLTRDMPFARLPDGDVYAPEVGFSEGFPAARDRKLKRAWLAHCYAMVGVGRDNDPTSGSGQELYVVIGHAPRHLDRNVALVGRVVQGMELLTSLPRGTDAMGGYAENQKPLIIKSVMVEADVPVAERTPLEIIRTDTATFAALVESRRNRHEEWFSTPTGHIDLCNVPIVVRPRVCSGANCRG